MTKKIKHKEGEIIIEVTKGRKDGTIQYYSLSLYLLGELEKKNGRQPYPMLSGKSFSRNEIEALKKGFLEIKFCKVGKV